MCISGVFLLTGRGLLDVASHVQTFPISTPLFIIKVTQLSLVNPEQPNSHLSFMVSLLSISWLVVTPALSWAGSSTSAFTTVYQIYRRNFRKWRSTCDTMTSLPFFNSSYHFPPHPYFENLCLPSACGSLTSTRKPFGHSDATTLRPLVN